MKPAVVMKGITKQFPLVLANDNVDFEVMSGEIHALVGENGAGKSTLMNILYGLYVPTEGEIEIFGHTVKLRNALDAIENGIGMVHQHFMLIPRLSVAENIVIGKEPRKNIFFYDHEEAVRRVEAICREYSIFVDARARVSTISLGMQQRTEIVKTLYHGAEIIILDEPTAILTPQEIEELGNVLQKLKSLGKTIIIITHKLEEVMKFSDRVTVLRQGKKVGTIDTDTASISMITQMMVGKDVSLGGHKQKALHENKDVVLSVKDLSVKRDAKKELAGISFDLKQGEILGISGIDGSGQTELAEALAGVRPVLSGQVVFKGKNITDSTISERKQAGIAFVPQDRHKDGLVLNMSVEDNLILGQQGSERFSAKGKKLNRTQIKENAITKIESFDIRTPGETALVSTLSGGNQQKIVVAREIGDEIDLIIADQPTRGIDVAAIEFIHEILTEKRDRGSAIILVSMELDEVFMLSDRIAVMHEGKIVDIVDPAKTTREMIGLMMLDKAEGNAENKAEDKTEAEAEDNAGRDM